MNNISHANGQDLSSEVREMWDVRESLLTDPNYNTPVKDLMYKDLLTRTFTLASHDPNIGKTTGKKGLSHRAKNHYQHRVVLIENVSWNSLLW